MISEIDAQIDRRKNRQLARLNDAETDLNRLKVALSEHADGIRSDLDAEGKRINLLMSSVGVQACVAADTMNWLRDDNAAMRENLKANAALLRRQARWAWAALGGTCLAAGVILLLAIWGAYRLTDRAAAEADMIRAANVRDVAAAREAGQRAIAQLHTELATQREEIERQIGVVGAELAVLSADRDTARADLEHFAALRDRLGIFLVDGRSQPVIVAPEGQEIRPWRAAGLHELARYNGRMYRVMARE